MSGGVHQYDSSPTESSSAFIQDCSRNHIGRLSKLAVGRLRQIMQCAEHVSPESSTGVLLLLGCDYYWCQAEMGEAWFQKEILKVRLVLLLGHRTSEQKHTR